MRSKILLILILFLGLGLRCIDIQTRGIIYDDAFSFFLSSQSLGEIVQGTAADTMPPLFYFLLHFWMGLGQELWVLRLLGILLNLFSTFLLYLLVKHLFGESAGLVSAFISVISPFQIYHAQDLRMYTLVALCQAAYALFFVRIWCRSFPGDPENRIEYRESFFKKREISHKLKPHLDWVGLIVSGVLAMYTHNLAIFVLVVPTFFLLMCRDWRLLVRLLLAQILIGLFALPWLFLVPGQIAKIQQAFWTPKPGLIEVIQAVIMFSAALPLEGIWLVLGAIISVEVMVMVIIETIRASKECNRVSFLAAFAFLPPILLFMVSYIMRPIFVPRAFIFSSLAFLGLAGYLIVKNWVKGPGIIIGISFVLAAGIALPYQYQFTQFPRSPFFQASVFLAKNIQPDDIVIHDNKLSYFPFLYYDRNLPQEFLGDIPGSSNDTLAFQTQQAINSYPAKDIQSAVDRHTQVYYVIFHQVVEAYEAGGTVDPPLITWLKQHYRLANQITFNDLDIYKFVK